MKNPPKIQDLPIADCFTLEQLLAFLDRNMPEEKLKNIEKHMEVCDMCKDALTGYKKISDKQQIKNAVHDLAKTIQLKTGVEESEVIVKPDYKIPLLIACLVGVIVAAYFFAKPLFTETQSSIEDNLHESNENNQANSDLITDQKKLLLKADSIQVLDSAKSEIVETPSKVDSTAVNKTIEATKPDSVAITIPKGPRKNPLFPGGDKALSAYINDNRKYPQGINCKGFVTVAFTLDETGKVVKTRVPNGKGLSPECDEEAQRIFKSMSNWIPANDGTKNLGGEWRWDVEF